MIKILIADDQLLFRSMLGEMLMKDPEFEIVASCPNGDDAVVECLKHRPDVVLLDIGMPGKDGIQVLREIKQSAPETKVTLLTTFEDSRSIREAVRFSADGYLIKEMTPEALISAVKSIHSGIVLFHRGAYKCLREALSESETQSDKNKKIEIDGMVFDAADINIMKLIAKGKSNRDIAAALNYSEGTIKNKISRLLSETGLADRTEISVFAINNNLI